MAEELNYWKNTLSRRVTRRGVLSAGAAGLAMLAVGCTGGSTPQARTEPGKPKRGGTLQVVVHNEVPTLEPHWQTWGGVPINPMYNGLLRITDKLTFEPDLAEGYEQPDDVTYVFKLVKGVKFHDVAPVSGREMTSDDVVYTWKRMATDDPRFLRRSFWNQTAKVEAVDKYTVKFVNKVPFAPFIAYVANPWSVIVPKEAIEKFENLSKTGIGTGPFMLKERKENVSTTLVRNPNYFKQGLPYLDNVVVTVIPDRSSAVAAVAARQLDWMSLRQPEAESLKKQAPEIIIDEYAGISPWPIRLMCDKPPYNNVKVRQAIMWAADAQEMIDVVFGGKGVKMGPIPPAHEQYALPASELPKPDLDKAKKLLAEAGYPNGFKTALTLPNTGNQTDSGVVLKKQLAKVGIDAELILLEYAAYLKTQYDFNYEMSLHSDSAFLDPDEFLYQQFHSNGARNLGRINDSKLDQLLEKTRSTVRIEERKKVVLEAQRYLQEIVPYVQLFTPNYFQAWQPYVKDWKRWYFGDNANPAYEYIWLDK